MCTYQRQYIFKMGKVPQMIKKKDCLSKLNSCSKVTAWFFTFGRTEDEDAQLAWEPNSQIQTQTIQSWSSDAHPRYHDQWCQKQQKEPTVHDQNNHLTFNNSLCWPFVVIFAVLMHMEWNFPRVSICFQIFKFFNLSSLNISVIYSIHPVVPLGHFWPIETV